jgi:hypothetical protein
LIQLSSSKGTPVNPDDITFLSPYLTSNLKRFGKYELDFERIEGWIRDSLFAGPAHSLRRPKRHSSLTEPAGR